MQNLKLNEAIISMQHNADREPQGIDGANITNLKI